MSEIMSRVDLRRKRMIEAGEEVTVLRESDLVRTPAQQGKRLPPHLAGPTQDLSDEVQAKDFDQPSQEPRAGGEED